MIKILVIEDEQNISSFIQRGLTHLGYEVKVCIDGKNAWQTMQEQTFDLIIMDIIMPYLSGWELCQLFREKFGFTTPIILLTALSSTENIVKGLEFGADDYLPKPFKFSELEARMKALLRRHMVNATNNAILQFSDLELDTNSKQAIRDGILIDLTAKEYSLLEFFIKNPNKVLSRQVILEQVWNLNFDTNTNLVDVYVNYIRNKIQTKGSKKLIHTVIGLGYIMKE